MDNRASQTIKKFLTKTQCKLMLVEPHNHCVNAAERAIQTFKDHFFSALTTTDSNFPLQLWDRLAPQVNTLNMLRPLRINPNMLTYEAVHGSYDRNCFFLAPPGCKAVIYKSLEACTLWGSRAPTRGTSGCHSTTIDATTTLTQKHELIGSPAWQNCSHNIAKFPFGCGTNTCKM